MQSLSSAVLFFLAAVPMLLAQTELKQAEAFYARTEYREAIQALRPLANAKDPIAHALLGKAYFGLAEYKKSAEAFERALELRPNHSEYYHWLGKAIGRRAETSNPLSAPLLASRARGHFEKAVELDPKNAEAVNDLFSYYLEAPGFLGGGLNKAAALAETRIKSLDPVEYHYAMAQIAERKKQWKSAENHFRQAFTLAPQSVGRAIDLARFLSKQGRERESEAVFAQAEKIAPNEPKLMFERAKIYIRVKKNLPQARHLLERYLQAPLSPEDPPRAEAMKLLREAESLGA
jgi:tetratricopeptide (TPR) repeat protein